jgi:hypothetical protein
VVSTAGPTAVNLGFLDQSRYFAIHVTPQLSSRRLSGTRLKSHCFSESLVQPGLENFSLYSPFYHISLWSCSGIEHIASALSPLIIHDPYTITLFVILLFRNRISRRHAIYSDSVYIIRLNVVL